jgi:hypothetical protein
MGVILAERRAVSLYESGSKKFFEFFGFCLRLSANLVENSSMLGGGSWQFRGRVAIMVRFGGLPAWPSVLNVNYS